ncbi:lactonase family protein [Nitrospirillum iridis]|uniref:6-phosphogluconolactonase n=1 Tax=Nitrospirillum iridis TaxID=765888 RepID=A0A7X0B402_9PROT|nr:lactonase family protein [Nitrospirillum iridis]MBB6255263.1 6-phosphogluconolactonase [Nitrospirillum iridis]
MSKQQALVFIGTQANAPGQGIFAAVLDEETGGLRPLGCVAEIARPTWLLRDRRRPVLFSVSELGNAGDRDGEVWSFEITGVDGTLRSISRTSSGGGGATHLALDPASNVLLVANFGGANVAAVPVGADGDLSSIAASQATSGSGPHRRQQGPHPHGVTVDPSAHFVLVPDMGADRVFIYRFDGKQQTLTPADCPAAVLPAGAGPRLLHFGPDGRFAYLLTELSAEIYVFSWHPANGELAALGRIALDPPGTEGQPSAAAFLLSADGRFLYASNRRTHEIHVFAIAPNTGAPSEVQRIAAGGEKPWGAELSPDGRWLLVANQGTDTVTVFKVDEASGTLTRVPGTLSVPAPTAVAFA